MAEVKNFGLIGVGSSVQLGKGGSRILGSSGIVQMKAAVGEDFVRVKGADPTEDDDLVTLRHLTTIPGVGLEDGMGLVLGTPTDTSLADGAIALTPTHTVTNAIDSINELLGLLVPAQPPEWPNGTAMTIVGVANWQLASGAVPNNTGDALPSAGTNVPTIFATTAYTTTTAGDAGDAGSGPGTSGTMTAVKNGSAAGSRALTTGSDVGTYGDLNIQSNPDYPSGTPGFWRSITARATGSGIAGYNKIQITHSDAGSTLTRYWMADTTTPAAGTIGGPSVSDAGGTTSSSSSIPHYNQSQTITVAGTLNDISGYTYRLTDAVSVQGIANVAGTASQTTGNGQVITATDFDFGDAGMPANPRPMNDTEQPFSVSATTANVHALGRIAVRHRNPRSGSWVNTNNPQILVMGAATTSAIDEDNILATPFIGGRGRRVDMAGDSASATPDATFTSTTANWNGAAALEAFDATVVGGVLRHNQNNYSTGYLPVGPNLSGQTGSTQYVTFMLRGVFSNFTIGVTGGYSSCRVKLPGVSDNEGVYYDGGTSNGWWNMYAAYAGAGVPGNGPGSNGSIGCAVGTVMAGSGGNYVCSFGTASSNTSTNNIILVRFGLNSGQSITALSFS